MTHPRFEPEGADRDPAASPAALLAVAHGSPDPRARPVLTALVRRIRLARPGLTARLAHLGHTPPDVPTAVAGLARSGARTVVVVPLLLSSAFHARQDLPAVLASLRAAHPGTRLVQSAVLGPDPRLIDVLRRRLQEAGAARDAAVVLGAVGTSHRRANADLDLLATGLQMHVGYAAGEPRVADVVSRVRTERGGPVAIASYTLAPGILPDRFTRSGADTVAAPLGDTPEVAAVVLDRFDAARSSGPSTTVNRS